MLALFALSVYLISSLLTACSNTPSNPSRPSLLPGPYSSTPFPAHAAHGTLVLSNSQFPDSLNPLFAGSDVGIELEAALWARPVAYDQQFHVHPDLLTEVPLPENGDVRDGGKTIIMHLRHDLRWSDGQPLLASDFQYWWRLNQDPNTGALLTSGYDQIASIDTPDTFTVVLHMKQPFGPYLFYLPYAAPQHTWGHMNSIDLQNTPSVFQAPTITDGPYVVSKYIDGRSIIMVPNPHYRSSTFHGPFLSQLTFQAYPDINALSVAALQQQTDVSLDYMEYQLPLLAHAPSSVHVLETATAAYEHLDFNNAKPFFHDVRVRRAIQMAIDKCTLLTHVLHAPNCDRAVSQVEPLPSLVYDPTIPASIYNPAEAKTLLAQAGWTPDANGTVMRHGQSFTIRLVTTADNPLRAAIAQQVQRDLKTIGIQATIAYYPLGSFFAVYTRGGILATGNYDMSLFTYANGPEPDDEYAVYHSSQIPSTSNPYLGNYGRVQDAIIDRSLTSARNTVIFADRVKDYHQFLERLADQVYMIPLFTDLNITVVSSRAQNIIPHPTQPDTTWNISDWWVQ
ncbi:MAG TPA: peptide ABC transporter substrate-binding protein, partial [Ktedonobacteraceae bacterium]|nr:peptide ABC transporter substrate-binding protein [Ktedonobacteraceae bacterium]